VSKGPAVPEVLRRRVEAIERAERLDPVWRWAVRRAAPITEGRAGDALRGTWMGHALHPLLTDIPLGCWMSSGLLDVLGRKTARRASQRLVGIGLLAVPVTVAAGVADWSAVRGSRSKRVGLVHGVGNLVVSALYLKSWRARRRGQHARGVLLGLVGGSLAMVTGYLGGHLSYNLGAGVGDRGMRRSDIAPTAATATAAASDGAPVDQVVAAAGPVDDWEGLD
jgi:uncharacterized membrane protein